MLCSQSTWADFQCIHVSTMGPWETYFTSLYLSFVIIKVQIIRFYFIEECVCIRIKCNIVYFQAETPAKIPGNMAHSRN